MYSKMDDTMDEEEMFASPNTVCTGCPIFGKGNCILSEKDQLA